MTEHAIQLVYISLSSLASNAMTTDRTREYAELVRVVMNYMGLVKPTRSDIQGVAKRCDIYGEEAQELLGRIDWYQMSLDMAQ